jgi:subtilase family serine protease
MKVRRFAGVVAAAVLVLAVPATANAAPSTGSVGAASVGQSVCPPTAPGSVHCLSRLLPASAGAVASRSAAPAATAGSVAPPTEGYGPADIKGIYKLPTGEGRGRTVAIVDAYDNPNAEADLAAFRSAYGLRPCTTANGCFRKVDQRGGTAYPVGDPGWGLEIALDVQAVSSSCPNCKILLVEADSASIDDIGLAVNRAVTMGARIVSNSYGGDEYTGVLADGQAYYSHPGVAMVVSSGDWGFGPASFPASWNRAIAVGGTSVTKTATGWSHSAWEGAGSGCSAWVAKPRWQKDANCLMRTVSDISALADPATGFAVYDTYGLDQFGLPPGWLVVGGTSLAAPLVAGMIGLAGDPEDLSSASRLYSRSAIRGLLDVVGGSNAIFNDCGGDYLCTGVVGYDGPTGVGTPVGISAF